MPAVRGRLSCTACWRPGTPRGGTGEYVDVHPLEARALDCLAVRLSGAAGLRARVLGPAGYHAESDTILADGGTVVLDDVLLGGQHRVLGDGGRRTDRCLYP